MSNIYEYDNLTPRQLRDQLGWANDPQELAPTVLMALCKQVAELQREVQRLRRGLAQVVQMPLEK